MWWSVFFLAFCLQQSSQAELELSTNGPVYYKAPLAIFAVLKNADSGTYDWIFSADLPSGPFERKLYRGDRAMINETFHIKENEVGQFSMAVSVSFTPFLFPKVVAYGEINFVLTNKIPVTVEFTQNGTALVPHDGVLKVSSTDIVNATTRINDPSGYFQKNGTQLTALWKLNHELRLKNASYARMYPSTPGKQDTLQMFLTADDSNNTYIADGSVSTRIEAVNPLLYLNVTGKLWLHRGNLTHLEFACNASPPIFYCVKFLTPTNVSATDDFNCSDSDYIRRDACYFSVTHYFGNEGDHEIQIAVRNLVNDFLHWDAFKSNYTVHVYEVASKGLLRLFIVPISCVILGTIVAVSGYVLYDRTKGNMRIEVADFDFASSSTREELDASLVERTFWTHLRDELAESSAIFRWLARKPPQPATPCNHENQEDKPMFEAEP